MELKYYKLLFLLLVLAIQMIAQAQEKTNLNPVDDFSYTEHASQVTKDNSSVKSPDYLNTSAKDSIIIGDGDINIDLPGIEISSGKTTGTLSVSLTGAAVYAVPLTLPPGIDKVIPELALTYNSQSGDGLAGFGWNLSGLSSITRIPSTKYHDGVIDPVDFDNLDRFALDGQRLVLKSGTYGGNNAQYETENYSNLKITSHGFSNIAGVFGPSYFMVRYPDGSIAQYGISQSGASSHLEYALSYWQNPQGIRINYEYSKIR